MLRDSNLNASGPLRDHKVETHLEQFVRLECAVRHYDPVVEEFESTADEPTLYFLHFTDLVE